MKTRLLYYLILFIFLNSFVTFDSVLKEIGCTEESANRSIYSNFYYGSLYPLFGDVVYKNIPKENRAAIVNKLGDYIKSYVNSTAFKEKYLAEWESSKPIEPEKPIISNAKTDLDNNIKQFEEQLNNPALPQEQKDMLKQNIESLKQMQNNPEFTSTLEAGDKMQQESKQKEYDQNLAKYKTDLAEWEQMKNINYMIKKRLKSFLVHTENIDFNAKLVPDGYVYRFENPELEAKDPQWKYCFRAGKETINAARLYATNWLKTLN